MTEYDPADDARKSYDVAVEAKRQRGDKHWPERLSPQNSEKSSMTDTPIDFIAEAITDSLGSRCPDHSADCPTCEAWAEYDRLKGIAALYDQKKPPVLMVPDDATAEEILQSTIDHPNAVVMLKRMPDARAAELEGAGRNATCHPIAVRPGSLVNDADIRASDTPDVVVKKLDAAFAALALPTPVAPISPDATSELKSGDAQDIADRLRRFFKEPGDARRLALDAALMIEYLNKKPTGKCGELVTVRYEIIETLPSGVNRWQCVEHECHANEVSRSTEFPSVVNALCHRSQAEELLAAKDKQIALAETSMLEMHQDLNKLEAELAAERAEKEIAERNRDAARDNFLTMQKSAAKLLERAEKAEADNARQAARIKELEGHIYVPGSWHCPKCKFTLQQMVMSAQDCSVAPQEKPGEPCPNCQSPLWRVTWKQDAMEMSDRVEEQMNATKALEAKLAAAIPPSGEGA